MTVWDKDIEEFRLEARTQANRPAICLSCGGDFRQDCNNGVYGLTFCKDCIKAAKGKMPPINHPVNAPPEPVKHPKNPTEY